MYILDNGFAVLENDTHISKWVKDSGTLEIAVPMLTPFKQYIPEGGCVVDVGASIGDHTLTYAKWVGHKGMVWAFEPYIEAYKCLVHNVNSYLQVAAFNTGLSNSVCQSSIQVCDNAGASYITDSIGDIRLETLDCYEMDDVNFIKLDIEGFEFRAIQGAVETIKRCRPVMLVEVNRYALERAGTSSDKLGKLITSLGYHIEITDKRIKWNDPQFDILCLPN